MVPSASGRTPARRAQTGEAEGLRGSQVLVASINGPAGQQARRVRGGTIDSLQSNVDGRPRPSGTEERLLNMLSRRTPLAALVAVTAAGAVAVPAASASAATTGTPTVDPQVCQLLNPSTMGSFNPAQVTGGPSLVNVLANAGASVGCAPTAPQPSPVPAGHRPTKRSAPHRHATLRGGHRPGRRGLPHN
jgi:hypothetical protein